jgi:hypothetical protein
MSENEQEPYEAEVQERWGDTEAYKQSKRRTGSYTPDDWTRIKAENESIEVAMADLMAGGAAPDGDEAMELAEKARLHIHRWYYECSTSMHAGLAEMYTADPRFRAHYDDRAEGLAEFVATAIKANAARA